MTSILVKILNRIPVYKTIFFVHQGGQYHENDQFKILRLDDFDAAKEILDGLNRKELSHEESLICFNQNAVLWLAYLGESCCGYGWSKHGRKLDNFLIPVIESDATIYNCKVFKEFRGKGIYPTLLSYMVKSLLGEGVKRCFIDCRSYNHPSVSGIKKAGFVVLGTAIKVILAKKPTYLSKKVF